MTQERCPVCGAFIGDECKVCATPEEPKMMTIKEFIEKHKLSMTCKHCTNRPDEEDMGWAKDADHWFCVIKKDAKLKALWPQTEREKRWMKPKPADANPVHPVEGDEFHTFYSMGSAHRDNLRRPKRPKLPDVLDSLAMDISCVMNGESFQDFCDELGYDFDSRRHEKVYNACKDAYEKLKKFLGRAATEELINEVERL